MFRLGLFLCAFALYCYLGACDFGSCRYDPDRCSCRMGNANQGKCWDKIEGTNECSRRPCKAGWTCSCGGRTHVCHRLDKQIRRPKSPLDVNKTTAVCTSQTVPLVSSRQFTLGTLKLHISRAGILANDCTRIAWWLDGELLGNRKSAAGISTSTVDQEISDREDHSLLELLPGSLVAWRFKDGSFYCFKYFAEMMVNKSKITSSTAGVTIYYAREYTKDWFMPSYKLTSEDMGVDESETDLKKFIPLRKKKLTSDTQILEGVDYWQPISEASADNRRSNWYFRMQIPDPLP